VIAMPEIDGRERQIAMKRCSCERIMRHPHFAHGLNDIRAGLPFADRITDPYWAYERGRLFGAIAPLTMPLFINRRINPNALRLFASAGERRLIP
jgi:hypothetical protein